MNKTTTETTGLLESSPLVSYQNQQHECGHCSASTGDFDGEPFETSTTTAPNNSSQAFFGSAQVSRTMMRQLRIVLIGTILLVAIFSAIGSSFRSGGGRVSDFSTWFTSTVSSNLFGAADLVPPSASQLIAEPHPFTFQELAKERMSALYLNMWEQAVPVLTEGVQPSEVYASRKLILKTRDLLDLFSPVYPNATSVKGVEVDMWKEIRNHLDKGYEVIGTFQDLDHAHVQYTPEMFDSARDTVLQWRRDFEDFHQKCGFDSILEFLQNPSVDSFRHRESRLFWKTTDTLPAGSDPASSSLHKLGSRQTSTALVYLTLAFQYDSVLRDVAHDHYHNLRKELRSMTDEYDLLGTYMFPKSCLPSIKLFKSARVILGDINDMWTAYDNYVTNHKFKSEQLRLAKAIDHAWQDFRIWVEEVDFEAAIRNVTLSMHQNTRSSDDDSSGGE